MMELSSYKPRPALVSNTTSISSPRFPVIDAHNHLGEFGGDWLQRPLPELLDALDQAGVRLYVDLDGGWGEQTLDDHLRYLHPAIERFRVFGGVDWSAWLERGDAFPDWAAGRLRIQKERGAFGVKIWKNLGLRVQDQRGELVRVDDSRLDPLWQAAGELEMPVLIHVADPVAFFEPLDEFNERWEELHQHPDWQFPSPPFPSFLSILTGLANLVSRHPRTTFIGAHVGCYAENLSWVAALLDRCPNFYVDISARIAELGRQPYSARRFFIQYADRILFGSDFGPDLDTYRIMYRFLESDDEYFAYSPAETPPQGRWCIYGLHLPAETLEKVYYRNAQRLLQVSDAQLWLSP